MKKNIFLVVPVICMMLALGSCITAQQAYSNPHIDSIKWGEVIVSENNKTHKYHDAKVWPTKSREWNWKETGTMHVPGIQIDDIEEFINEVDIVILTRGMHLVLQVPQATIDYIKQKGKKYYIGQTEEMVKLYNSLIKQGKKVGGVFHSTC